MSKLAITLFFLKRTNEALKLLERAATLAYEVFGDDHPKTKEILDLRDEILNG